MTERIQPAWMDNDRRRERTLDTLERSGKRYFDPEPDITAYELAVIMASMFWAPSELPMKASEESVASMVPEVARHWKPAKQDKAA